MAQAPPEHMPFHVMQALPKCKTGREEQPRCWQPYCLACWQARQCRLKGASVAVNQGLWHVQSTLRPAELSAVALQHELLDMEASAAHSMQRL